MHLVSARFAQLVLIVGLSTCLAPQLHADVKLHGLFTDHMVLQRDHPAAVYGTAGDGEEIAVQLGDAKAETTARELESTDGVLEVLRCGAGPGARLMEDHLF